jgi:tetratricopeptide (TPR) repeat protein
MPKQAKWGLVICLIIGLGFAGYAIYKSKNKIAPGEQAPPEVSSQEKLVYAKQLQEAQTDLQKADNDKDKLDAYSREGMALYMLGMLDDAKNAYLEAIKLDPEKASTYTEYFDVQVALGDYQGANDTIKKAISLNTNSTRWKKYINFQKDQLKYTNEQLDKSYNDALADTKDDVDVVIAYAQFLESAGNDQKAIEQWQKAGTIKPEKKADYDAEISRIQSKG